MDSRRIDYLASRPATFLTFAVMSLNGAAKLVDAGLFRSPELDMVLDGMVEAHGSFKAGTLHYEVPEYMQHILILSKALPKTFWVKAGFPASAVEDTLAQVQVEGHA